IKNLIWPQPPQNPKIALIGYISSERDLGLSFRKKLAEILTGEKSSIKKLVRPVNVAVDNNGKIFVVDLEYNNILVFDRPNKKSYFIGNKGRVRLIRPMGIKVDNSFVYISDNYQNRIFVYDKEGDFETAFGGDRILNRPVGIALDKMRNLIWVANTYNHEILAFDLKTGKLVRKIGKRGRGKGEFNFPSFIAVDNKGRIYITDFGNFRIQIFDSKGNFINDFGSFGEGPGNFSRPKGIALDSDGYIYVVDSELCNFQVFNINGNFLLRVGQLGQELGEFDLPVGIYIDEQDYIYVADQLNGRIQIFKYLKGKKPPKNTNLTE
ncbi:6-bladed beta-propeller, partial [Candidatus Aminicenantes bacterium AC-335-B20]|nr:6-bladed beta-propeller [Candidatus Aminicenantes bacterium AC-335-B20]